jgi:hypothetical protein
VSGQDGQVERLAARVSAVDAENARLTTEYAAMSAQLHEAKRSAQVTTFVVFIVFF